MPRERQEKQSIRVRPSLWAAAMKRADERGETVSEAIRKFLERYSDAGRGCDIETKRAVYYAKGYEDGQAVALTRAADSIESSASAGGEDGAVNDLRVAQWLRERATRPRRRAPRISTEKDKR